MANKHLLRRLLTLLSVLGVVLGASSPLRAQTSVPPNTGARPEPRAMTGMSPNGQVAITIDQPQRATIVAPGAPVIVTGTASGGSAGGTVATNVVYVIDVSGSTNGFGGACGDPNGDGSADTILDCEIAGLTALNTSLGTANVDVSLVSFSSSAKTHDMSPVPATQVTTQPSTDVDGNGTSDVVDVLQSQRSGGSTNYDSALAQLQGLLVAGEQNVVIFLSDGDPTDFTTGPGSPLQAVADAGAIVLTFALGSGTSGCAAGAPLRDIADTTGGTCTEVGDPSGLSDALADVNLTGVDRVEIEVNGIVGIASVEASGRFSFVIQPELLRPGRNDIIARAHGADEVEGDVAVASTFVVRPGPPAPRP